ncbi:hypothetical protein BaRGS_00023671 [Batillaria attramentaria]|uniref:Uncharacterized protein n=1 Tax=Batillaria attramentaria TaxID=370345 RepID=A0ABD0KDF8_9CAEN
MHQHLLSSDRAGVLLYKSYSIIILQCVQRTLQLLGGSSPTRPPPDGNSHKQPPPDGSNQVTDNQKEITHTLPLRMKQVRGIPSPMPTARILPSPPIPKGNRLLRHTAREAEKKKYQRKSFSVHHCETVIW